MKKYVIIFCSLLAVSVILLNAQTIMQNSNVEKSSYTEQTNINMAASGTTPAEEPKKVLMHYMGWFGPDSLGRHWEYSLPSKPLIGYYNSQSWATQMYHILLSWSCGIDGLVINVKTDYDDKSLKMLTTTLKRIREIDSINFIYEFAVSYDDKGMDIVDIDTAVTKFTSLRDDIIHNNPSYLRYNDIPVIFIYNYKLDTAENILEYITASHYRIAIDSVFSSIRPKVIWNEIDTTAKVVANSFYPWVKADPAWNDDGSNWGKKYLEWYYPTIAETPGIDFVIGGVWPGFDDRLNTEWGKNRWMHRYNGAIYDSTWIYLNNYDSDYPASLSPLKWVYIETWNDWNEGSEIEPSEEFGYQYLKATIKNINAFKDTTISEDTCKFLAALKIYEAANLIEFKQRDSTKCYPHLKNAIKHFILNQCDSSLFEANQILNKRCDSGGTIKFKNEGIEIFPNPVKDKIQIRIKDIGAYTVQLTDIQGKVLLNQKGNKILETIDVSTLPKGIYMVRVKQKNNVFEKKIVIP